MISLSMTSASLNKKPKKRGFVTRQEVKQVKSKLNRSLITSKDKKENDCSCSLADLFMLDAKPLSFGPLYDLLSQTIDFLDCTGRSEDENKANVHCDDGWRQPLEPYIHGGESENGTAGGIKSYSRDTIRNRRYLKRKGMHRLLRELSDKYSSFSTDFDCRDSRVPNCSSIPSCGDSPLKQSPSMLLCDTDCNITENFDYADKETQLRSRNVYNAAVLDNSSQGSPSKMVKSKSPLSPADSVEDAAASLIHQVMPTIVTEDGEEIILIKG